MDQRPLMAGKRIKEKPMRAKSKKGNKCFREASWEMGRHGF